MVHVASDDEVGVCGEEDDFGGVAFEQIEEVALYIER